MLPAYSKHCLLSIYILVDHKKHSTNPSKTSARKQQKNSFYIFLKVLFVENIFTAFPIIGIATFMKLVTI